MLRTEVSQRNEDTHYIVTDLINALPGNSPTHTRGQQYGRSVFYVIRATQQ
jgi:hypothetical protein